jgi:membrane-associated PAP2 superfamily phosphatase
MQLFWRLSRVAATDLLLTFVATDVDSQLEILYAISIVASVLAWSASRRNDSGRMRAASCVLCTVALLPAVVAIVRSVSARDSAHAVVSACAQRAY